MFTHKKTDHSYQLTLQDDTAPEVVQWFAQQEAGGRLSDALASLVYNLLSSSGKIGSICLDEQPAPSNHDQDNDFYDNLYKWQESNTQVFKDDGRLKDQPQKRKMLSV